MANEEVKIKIRIDSNSQELVLMKQQVQEVGKSFNHADSFANTFMKRINLAGHIYVAYQVLANTLGAVAKRGFEVNKEMQKLTNSLTMSSAVMMANNDIYGNAVTVADKYKIAQLDAAKSTELLQKANINTPHTMKQTVQIYDSMYFGMKKVGASTADMVEITEKLSIAAGNKIGFDAFLSAMDGISTGTVEANSEMGRFLGSIGLTNEEIKNSADVVQLFKDKLSGFQAIQDFETKMSNLNNSIDIFSKNVMKIPFDYLESKIPLVAGLFGSWAKSINEINIELSNASNLSTYDELIIKQYKLLGEIAEVKNNKFMWDSEQKAKLKELNGELEIVFKKLTDIGNLEKKASEIGQAFDSTPIDKMVKETLDPYSVKLEDINKKWQTNYQDMQKNGKDVSGVIKAWEKDISTLDKEFADKNQKVSDSSKKTATDVKKRADEINNAYLEISQIGLSEYSKSLIAIAQKTNDWEKAGVSANDALRAQSMLLDELNVKTQIATAKTDLSYLERKIQLQNDSLEKELELANISYGQKVLDISGDENIEADRKRELLALEDELYAKTVERLTIQDNIEELDIVANKQISMLDAQLEMINATNSWGNSLGGVLGALSNISTAYKQIEKVGINTAKNQINIDTKLAKVKEKFGKDTIEYVEAENEHIMDTSKNKLNTQIATTEAYDNTIAAVTSLTSVVANYGEKSETAAKVAMAAERGLAVVQGVRAIIRAWSDPFPLYLATVPLTIAAVGGLLGQMGGGSSGGGSVSVPSVADTAQDALDFENTMITDRLDRQIELLEQLNLQGSASKLKVVSANVQFEYDSATAINTIRKTMEENVDKWAGQDALNTFNGLISHVVYKGDIVDYFTSNGPAKVWMEYSKNLPAAQWMGQYIDVTDRQFMEMYNNFQASISEFIGSVIDSIQQLEDTGDNLKETWDGITNSTKYADISLKKAFNKVDELRGNNSFADYIEAEINNIAKLENELSPENINLLLSEAREDLRAKIELVNEISAKTGMVFANGAEDVLNYIEDIELVSEAIITSIENIKEFEDSFKSDFTLANELAKNIGLNSLATDLESLDSLFIYLKSDTLGLVDAELELLQANKSLIESYNDVIAQLDNIISPKTLTLAAVSIEDVTLESATDLLDQLSAAKDAEIDRATTAINAEKQRLQKQKETAQAEKQAADTLKKAFENTTKSLNATYKNIIGQTSLADSFNITQYEKLYKEIDAGITAGTDINDLTSDFNSYATSYAAYIKNSATTQQEYDRKMKVLANEVKGLAGKSETASLNDLDNRLSDANNNLTSIDSSISSLDTNLQNKIDSINATYISQTQLLKDALEYIFKNNVSNTQTNTKVIDYSTLVEDAYKTVLGRASDVEGKKYWLEQLNIGKITEQDLYKTIANAAVNYSLKDYQKQTGDYTSESAQILLSSIKNAQKYLADNISQTTTTQTTNYYTQSSSDKALDEVVKELQRLNIISASNAENTKKLLKTNKQTLITGLQGA